MISSVMSSIESTAYTIVSVARASKNFLGRQWVNYVIPAGACLLAFTSTGVGAGIVMIGTATMLWIMSNSQSLGASNPQNPGDRRWVLQGALLVSSAVALIAAGFLFAQGTVVVGFAGIGLLIPALL